MKSSNFIFDNPDIVAKSEIDALIAEALSAEKAGQSIEAQTCIHQGLLLRACQERDWNKIDSFFRDLNAKDSGAKDSFVKDVKKIYLSIQEKAAEAPRHQGPTPESQARKMPLILQSNHRPVSQNPSGNIQREVEATQSQKPVVQGRDGRMYYADPQGKILHPASRRHDPERHRSQSDPIESSGRMAAVSIEERARGSANVMEGREDERQSLARVVSGPPGSLPPLPEGLRLEYTRIAATPGDVEKLDQRKYLLVHHVSYG